MEKLRELHDGIRIRAEKTLHVCLSV